MDTPILNAHNKEEYPLMHIDEFNTPLSDYLEWHIFL